MMTFKVKNERLRVGEQAREWNEEIPAIAPTRSL